MNVSMESIYMYSQSSVASNYTDGVLYYSMWWLD